MSKAETRNGTKQMCYLQAKRVLWGRAQRVEENVAGRRVVRAVHELGLGHFLNVKRERERERKEKKQNQDLLRLHFRL